MSNFERILNVVLGSEGNYTDNQADPGNWSGGSVGSGQCRGTKFGISAAAYPDLDIANLTLGGAQAIYRRDYWDKIAGDHLPVDLGLLVFDAAVNNGVGRAVRWLQQVVGVNQDGAIGPQTLQALDRAIEQPAGHQHLCAELLAQRMVFMAALPTWREFGLGWARRLCQLPYQSLTVAT
jgi:lysozyme family protein